MLEVEPPAGDITLEAMKQCTTPTSVDHDAKFGVPTLEELGKGSKRLQCGIRLQRGSLFSAMLCIMFFFSF